jgi:uncharacterized protein YqgC (DUF456 family)
MTIVWIILFILVALTCWVLALLGMAGTWILVGSSALYAWLIPPGRSDMGWGTVAILAVLAGIGELLEFAAGALGARKAGGSKRGVALSVVGSITGGIAGLTLGSLVVPVIGSVIGAILCAGLGAMIGAMLGERWKGRDNKESLKVGRAAFFGRVLGTLAKTLVGTVMLIGAISALFL